MTDTVPASTGPDADVQVNRAVEAIKVFAGPGTPRALASYILEYWRDYLALSPEQCRRVAQHFPLLGGHKVWCHGHHNGPCAPVGAT